MKLISILTPVFNEEENAELVYQRVKEVFDGLPNYRYEHIFIDNASTDRSLEILKGIARVDKNVKIIVNTRNFGWIRSPYYGILQANGDAVVLFVADLQDPPALILDFIKHWEDGFKIIIGTKHQSEENQIMFFIRKVFYNLMTRISETAQIKNFTGFGLYDKKFIDVLRSLDEQYPYFRGLVSELGFSIKEVPYVQPKRTKGKAKSDFYKLYDYAMLGFISHSKIPLRLSSLIGFGVSFMSFLVAMVYFIYKLLFWYDFSVGIAPLVIGIFFIGGVQLFFLGIIGEYISSILTQVKKRPLVIEKERMNFDA